MLTQHNFCDLFILKYEALHVERWKAIEEPLKTCYRNQQKRIRNTMRVTIWNEMTKTDLTSFIFAGYIMLHLTSSIVNIYHHDNRLVVLYI